MRRETALPETNIACGQGIEFCKALGAIKRLWLVIVDKKRKLCYNKTDGLKFVAE